MAEVANSFLMCFPKGSCIPEISASSIATSNNKKSITLKNNIQTKQEVIEEIDNP